MIVLMKDEKGRSRTKVCVLQTTQNVQIWLQDTFVMCSYKEVAAWVNGKTKGLRFVIAIGTY